MCANLHNTPLATVEIKEELRKFVAIKPLEFMVLSFLHFEIPKEYIIQILNCYDFFLGIVNDENYRDHLEKLDMHTAYGNDKFEKARSNSHEFNKVLDAVFLKEKNKISDFTIKYGVF